MKRVSEVTDHCGYWHHERCNHPGRNDTNGEFCALTREEEPVTEVRNYVVEFQIQDTVMCASPDEAIASVKRQYPNAEIIEVTT